jgi:hypothetical protein
MRPFVCLLAVTLVPPTVAATAQREPTRAVQTKFPRGLPTDTFPIGVWLQSPHNAERYKAIGIELYVGLFGGPTEEQLKALDTAGVRVICAQNEVGLGWKGKTIVGWMHGDEPDNAQGRRLTGYAPPIPPHEVVASYERMHRADPTRPILLNLGQGAAWDGWHGRGERTGHAEDYPEYCKGCDQVSFDIYPVTHAHKDVAGKLEFVGRGVTRLVDWTNGKKPVWACIETSHVNHAERRPTPEQVRSEVWIAIASGASGIVYFAHAFEPKFVEAGLLAHPEIAAAVAAINTEVRAAAPALLAPRADAAVRTATTGRVAVRVHRHDGALHVFSASLQAEPMHVRFSVAGRPHAKFVPSDDATAPKPSGNGGFDADYAGYAVRNFRIVD